MHRAGQRSVVVFAAALASSTVAAPYAMSLSETRDAVPNFGSNHTLIAIVVTAVTAVLTGALAWIATSSRSANGAIWLCALGPLFGILDTGLSLGIVVALADPRTSPVIQCFGGIIVGCLFGIVFGAPMGVLFGAAIAWLAYRAVSLRQLAARDTLERTARSAGAWLVACASVGALIAWLANSGTVAYAYPALGCGVLFVGTAQVRARIRARWLARVGTGDVRGWRIVSATTLPPGLELPLLNAAETRCDGVLVRVSERVPTYREALERREPFALVRRS